MLSNIKMGGKFSRHSVPRTKKHRGNKLAPLNEKQETPVTTDENVHAKKYVVRTSIHSTSSCSGSFPRHPKPKSHSEEHPRRNRRSSRPRPPEIFSSNHEYHAFRRQLTQHREELEMMSRAAAFYS